MHLTENDILLYLEGKTSKERKKDIETHFSECADCTSLLSELYSLKKEVDLVAPQELDSRTWEKALRLVPPPKKKTAFLLSRPKLYFIYSATLFIITLASVLYIYHGNTHEILIRKYRGNNLTGNAIHLFPGDNSSIHTVPFTFRWNPVKTAVQYSVDVFDISGNMVMNEMSADTVLHIATATFLQPGKTYLWKVEAFYPDGRSKSSSVYSFKYSPK